MSLRTPQQVAISEAMKRKWRGDWASRKGNKYGNKITVVDGIKFRSKKEADRYGFLKIMERGGAISRIELQPRFPLVVNGEKVGLMVADFRYLERGVTVVVEDVKGAKTLLWKLKWALAKVLYPHIDWRVT